MVHWKWNNSSIPKRELQIWQYMWKYTLIKCLCFQCATEQIKHLEWLESGVIIRLWYAMLITLQKNVIHNYIDFYLQDLLHVYSCSTSEKTWNDGTITSNSITFQSLINSETLSSVYFRLWSLIFITLYSIWNPWSVKKRSFQFNDHTYINSKQSPALSAPRVHLLLQHKNI